MKRDADATWNMIVSREVKDGPCAVAFQFADTNPLIIGGNTNTQGKKWVDCFHGLIDEVKLFNRALAEKEVLELSKATSP